MNATKRKKRKLTPIPVVPPPSIREFAGALVAFILRDAEFFNRTLRFAEAAGVAVSVEIINGNRLKVTATITTLPPDSPPAPTAAAGTGREND